MRTLLLPLLTFFLGLILGAIILKSPILQKIPLINTVIKQNTPSKYILPPRKLSNPLEILFDNTSNVDIDFSRQTATGSPLIFGGASAPSPDDQDTWNKLRMVGITIIRKDILIESELPTNITLENYKNNVNDVQNPNKWNLNNINKTNEIYRNAQNRGMKVMTIFSYAPKWLTYSGTNMGVPKDWDVYEDIIKKIYKLHRNYFDYIEIWNEPTQEFFLNLKDSGLTREEAYKKIYYHAYKAIKEAQNEINENRIIPIGGQVAYNPYDTAILEALLQDPQTENLLDFITYHNYESTPEPSWLKLKNILSKYNKEQIPIYLTEWNYNGINLVENRIGNKAIVYTANKFIDFLKMDIKIANYYSMNSSNRQKYINDDPSFAFYSVINNKSELLPQAKTWRILSVSMGLGKGESRIYNSQYSMINDQYSINDSGSNAIGFVNIFGQKGMAMVNDEDSEKIINVTMDNVPMKKSLFVRTVAKVYVASKDFDGGSVIEKTPPEAKNGKIQFILKLPAQSVMGVLLSEENLIQEFLDNFR